MRRNFWYFFIFIPIFILFFIKGSYSKDFTVSDAIDPYCNGAKPEIFLHEKEIRDIEIVLNNPREWIENAFRVLVEFNSEDSKTDHTKWFNFRIKDKYKKNFDSHLIVNFKESNLSCKFKAKVRITGDLWWHIDWKGGVPFTSIHVNLLDGHINNITRFKLFLPKAREGGRNEIFTTSLLRHLKFLAPRTFMVSSKINGISQEYIFQEDLRKEFLENSKLVEGPLLEGDERFTVDRIKDDKMIGALSLSRIINKNFSLRNDANRRTALSAVSALNLLYLHSHQTKSLIDEYYMPYDRLHINTDNFFLDKLNKEKFQTYEALIYALDAFHGQTYDDRRFYFDPINQYFMPIYYDGKSNIINDEQKSNLERLSKKSSIDAKKGASIAIKLIGNIDYEKFKQSLAESGVSFTNKNFNKIMNRIIKRLEVINNSDPELVEFLKVKKYFSEIKINEIKDLRLIFINLEKREFYICNLDLKSCDTKKNNELEFKNLVAEIISQRFSKLSGLNSKDTEYLFVYDDIEYDKEKYIKINTWQDRIINDDFSIKYNDAIKIKVLNEKKEINIEQTSNSGRAVISGKKIEDWNIKFNAYKKTENNKFLNNHLNLTGCLTLLDIEVVNISLSSKNSSCEDSINFIRTNGIIKKVNISNSDSDALDLDFSNLKINSIKIESAGNDCLDLSYGEYIINYIKVTDCGDKGISIGEKSDSIFKQIEIIKSNVAVAAKDSSIVEINKSRILESPICFSAYRKKQEFSGAKIKVIETNCDKNMSFVQEGSQIIFDL